MVGKVVVEIKGGLGNQLFQYAFGRELATAHGKDLRLDTRMLGVIGHSEAGTKRSFALDSLGLEVEYANKLDRMTIDLLKANKKLRLAPLHRLLERLGIRAFKERRFGYQNFGDSVGIFTWLSGYFQSEKYFPTYSRELRDKVFQGAQWPVKVDRFRESLSKTGGICVNVRRGDYVETTYHGALGSDYYIRGVSEILTRRGHLPIYIFSDDLEWCRKNLSFEGKDVNFVGHELAGYEFVQYLYIMSLFENFVIPNSTFAWWAVWLSGKNSGLVVAPETWFMGAPEVDTSDLIPANWIRIPNSAAS